jgi:hypothetical protein
MFGIIIGIYYDARTNERQIIELFQKGIVFYKLSSHII